ncbi:hypothetical protein [Methylibium sp.]|uniref:hypothetical protein n=1 Tax=Methylibium sp. TaxID=2067992 RepID=UPI003D1450B4
MSNFQQLGDWELKKNAAGNVFGRRAPHVYQTLDPLEFANYNGKFNSVVGFMTIEGCY